MKRLHAIIRGRVQGVGFRDAAWREARSLRLRGWVRNQLDGTVEVLAEGGENELRQLETFLRRGPRMANVTGLDIFWEPVENSDLPAPSQEDKMPGKMPGKMSGKMSGQVPGQAPHQALPAFQIR